MRSGQKIGAGRKLRQTLTYAERTLWSVLRDRRLNGRKFRRQHTVGPFVVDYCCTELKLIIELGGDVHAFQLDNDRRRQAYLEREGYRVVRFTNDDVYDNLQGVIETLWDITKSDQDSPSP